MRSRDRLPLALLVLLGLGFTAGNLWATLDRSTAPRAIDARVTELRTITEKHPGLDDTHLVRLDDGRRMQVDKTVFALLTPGAHVTKDAWAWRITVDGEPHPIAASPDLRGMWVAMPTLMAMVIALAIRARRPRTSGPAPPRPGA